MEARTAPMAEAAQCQQFISDDECLCVVGKAHCARQKDEPLLICYDLTRHIVLPHGISETCVPENRAFWHLFYCTTVFFFGNNDHVVHTKCWYCVQLIQKVFPLAKKLIPSRDRSFLLLGVNPYIRTFILEASEIFFWYERKRPSLPQRICCPLRYAWSSPTLPATAFTTSMHCIFCW